MTRFRAVLLASLSLTALGSTAAFAQSAPPAGTAAAEADDPSQQIVVTGTRRNDRTVADSPVPVDVITVESLTKSGFTETSRLLNELVPSFNFPQPSITDGTDVIRPATLRGLSPDQTLVLINGKRRHTTALLNINGSVGRGSAAVDINMIPQIAIGRVEVLRDGAAAQYGSDAIAGVINFQLVNARHGGRASVTYGKYVSDVNNIPEVTGLTTNAAGQPTTAADGTYNLNTTGKDRHVEDGRTVTYAATFGLPLGEEGYFDVAAEYQDRNPTNRTGYDPRRQYALIGTAVDPREFTFNRLSHIYGDARTSDMKLFANAALPLGDAVELYGFASYGFRDGKSAGFYRIPSDARNLTAIYPNGFLPYINTDLNDVAGTGGLRGDVGGFHYDLSGGYARNRIKFFITNTLNRSLGAASPQAFRAGSLVYDQAMANLDVSHEVTVGFLSKLTIAGGAEYRKENFQIKAGDPLSYANGTAGGAPGAQVFPGFQPVIGGQRVDGRNGRHNWSAYLEADASVTDRIDLQLAGRYEDYSDFGHDWNGKAAARFEVVKGFAIRGAASTGFRAPSLQQQFYAAQATNNVNGLLLDTVTLPVNNPVAIALGARPLKPETSVSYSVGAVFDAVPRLNVTVDAYQVSIDDRIVVTDNLTATRTGTTPSGTNPGLAIAQILNAAGFSTVNAARFFVNGVDTRTRGLDAVATYRMPLAGGRLQATAGFNYNKTKLNRILAAPGPLANVPGLVLFGRQEQLRLTDGQPRTKINLGLDFDKDWLGFTARTNRYGKVLAAGSELVSGTGIFNDVLLKAKWITDAEIRAKLGGDRFELAIGANNLFDVYPTKVPTGLAGTTAAGVNVFYPTTSYVTPYSAFSPFGFNGRYLYARGAVKF